MVTMEAEMPSGLVAGERGPIGAPSVTSLGGTDSVCLMERRHTPHRQPAESSMLPKR